MSTFTTRRSLPRRTFLRAEDQIVRYVMSYQQKTLKYRGTDEPDG